MPYTGFPGTIAQLARPALANAQLTGDAGGSGGFFKDAGGFSGFTGGLRSVTRNLKAGFAKDPRAREQASAELAYQEQMQQQELLEKRRLITETLFKDMANISQTITGMGSQNVPPSIMKLIDKIGANAASVLGDPNYAEELKWKMLAYADVPQAGGEAFTLSPGQVRYGPDGKPVAEAPAAKQGAQTTLGKIQEDLASGAISPDMAAAMVKKETYIAPTQGRQPTSLETFAEWAQSDDPMLAQAGKIGLGLEAKADGGLELKAIADPNSPTGITLVREQDAEGKPGVPPAAASALENKTDKEFEDKQVAVAQFGAQKDRIKKKLAEGTAVGLTGGLEQTLGGLSAQAQQLGQAFGADTSLIDPNNYTDSIPQGGAEASAALQSDIVGLAYTMALAQNGSRVTDNDVKRALQQIGSQGLLDDPRQIAAALDSAAESMQLNLTTEADVRGKTLKKAGGTNASEAGAAQENIPTVRNDADYNALPSGAVFIDPQGKKRRKP